MGIEEEAPSRSAGSDQGLSAQVLEDLGRLHGELRSFIGELNETPLMPANTVSLPFEVEPPEPDIDWDEVASTLNRLRPLVAEDDIRALSLWSETAGRVTEALGAQAAQIGHELDTYNFEGALALIDSAIAALPARTR